MKPAPFQRALVIGATSGIGEALARKLASCGAQVAAIGRREERLRALEVDFPGLVAGYAHDVTDYEGAPALFQRITGELGGLDAVFYVAGVMPEVALDEYDFGKDRATIEVNVLGAVRWLNLAAERFAHLGTGTIVGVGSVAGDRGRRGRPGYHASKAALHTYLESLRNRLSRQGVCVVTVKPGPVATPMTVQIAMRGKMDVGRAADLILAKSRKEGEHYLKLTDRIAFAIIRHLPGAVMRRLKL